MSRTKFAIAYLVLMYINPDVNQSQDLMISRCGLLCEYVVRTIARLSR